MAMFWRFTILCKFVQLKSIYKLPFCDSAIIRIIHLDTVTVLITTTKEIFKYFIFVFGNIMCNSNQLVFNFR